MCIPRQTAGGFFFTYFFLRVLYIYEKVLHLHIQKRQTMTTQEIKIALTQGQNFQNEAANWYSVCKPSENLYWIIIAERNVFCKNIDSAAKRISQLIKRGY